MHLRGRIILKITIPMMLERLFNVDFHYFPCGVSINHVSKIEILQNGHVSIESDVLYITKLSYLTSNYQGDIPQKIACIKDKHFGIDRDMFPNSDIIFIETLMETFELFYLLQNIFFYYSRILNELIEIVEENKGLQFLVDKISKVIGNPVCITNMNHKILAETSYELKNMEIYNQCKTANNHNGHLIRTDEQYFLIDNVLSRMDLNDKPVVFHKSEGYETSRIVYNLKVSKRHIAFFNVLEVDTLFTDSTIDLIVFLSRSVSLELQKSEMLLLNCDLKFADLFADLLSRDGLSNSYINKIFSNLNYSISNKHLLVVIPSPSASDHSSKITYLRKKILNFFKCNFCIIYEQNIVMIIESPTDSFFTDIELSKLRELLSITNMYAGISREFFNFTDIRRGYIEASKAVELGLRMNVGGHIFRYMDFQFDHLIDLCSKQEDIKSLCHPSLFNLIEDDNELSETLYMYMKNGRSQSKAARELHIHRSSLLYRLKKIEEVLEVSLDDYKTFLHLELSYEILHYLKLDNHPSLNNFQNEKTFT